MSNAKKISLIPLGLNMDEKKSSTSPLLFRFPAKENYRNEDAWGSSRPFLISYIFFGSLLWFMVRRPYNLTVSISASWSRVTPIPALSPPGSPLPSSRQEFHSICSSFDLVRDRLRARSLSLG